MGGKLKNPIEYQRKWREAHREQVRKSQAKYYAKQMALPEGRERKRLYAKKWRSEHTEASRSGVHRYYRTHKEEILTRTHKNNRELKQRVLTYYGNKKCACVKCGESRLACLSIDHIDGTGYEHRKIVGNGIRFYGWLKKNNFPSGYQTLCMNCQFIKREEQDECHKPVLD